MSDVLWRRLAYMLSPQLDIYRHLAPHLEGLDVLEVGFGTGIGTMQLVPRARSVTAIECNAEAVAFACKTLPRQADWQHADILDLIIAPTDPLIYQAAIMIEVLEHIKDWKLAISNVKALLKPGGKLFISARNANSDLRKNDLHEREWTASELRRALLEYFVDVTLFDYSLTKVQEVDTRAAQLVAVATKGNS